MSWHAETPALAAYVRGDSWGVEALSIEAHLMRCEECRAELANMSDDTRLDTVWRSVDAELNAPVPGAVERVLLRLGVPDYLARLLAATPSLRLSWFLAVAVALGFAVYAAHAEGGDRGLIVFLTGAPMIPLAGVAAAYGPGVDPTFEIGLAAPMRSFRLLLIRSAAVLASSIGLALVAAGFLPDVGGPVVVWLLPSLALSAGSLALSTRVPAFVAAGAIGSAWIAIVGLVAFQMRDALEPFGPVMQTACIAVAAASCLVLFRKQESFERSDRT